MWTLKYPERWEAEKTKLTDYGVLFEEKDRIKEGNFIDLHLLITSDSKIKVPEEDLPLTLQISFPSEYPYFRPEVYAQDVSLPRHQNIVDKNLCLLARASENWAPETLLADFLKEQLPKVFSEGKITDTEILKHKSDEQAEPVSEYYPAYVYASTIVDTKKFDETPSTNEIIESLGFVKMGIPIGSSLPCRMGALENLDNRKNTMSSLPKSLGDLYKYKGDVKIYRLAQRPPYADSEQDYKWIQELLKENNIKHKKISNTGIILKDNFKILDVIGITFPEEHRAGSDGWGWLFLIHFSFNEKNRILKKGTYYSKINRFNSDELYFRNPSLRNISSKKIAVFGLGALGAPSVIEFAKNGVGEIRIIDFDIVSAGTIVRWPLGISAAGKFKTDALEEFCNSNYPFVHIKKYNWRLGSVGANPEIDDILKDVTLIYDAIAENGVSYFISEQAKERNIPYINIYATPGVWGGAIMKQIPKTESGCWICMQYSFEDGLIQRPPIDENGDIQASGCGDITFTGSSFELAEIVNSGVRLAIKILSEDDNELNADIGILSLVDEYGKPILPKWESFNLEKHPKCPYCNSQ